MSATRLFEFHFKAPLDDDRQIVLEEALGARIRFSDYGNSPVDGYIGERRRASVFLDEWGGEDRDPDLWIVGASTHYPDDYDREAVDAVAQRIRQLLPEIADWWEEVPREAIRR